MTVSRVNQIVPPRELHIDLREGVFDAISHVDKTIVNANCKKDDCGKNCEENSE
jgi:hypothetical protein